MNSGKNNLVSIIIPHHNNETILLNCIKSIYELTYSNFEVIVVDNLSTDKTIDKVKHFPVNKIITIDKYLPGKALNMGIEEAEGQYFVFLSAHCIPVENTWLQKLVYALEENVNYAGVYGRQEPMSFTSNSDRRDLLLIFGLDRKIQIKDSFFHNANSMLPRAIWDKFPFDEKATNIEDRIWGKLVIEAGYEIIYEPSASVYHYHGLHQHGNSSIRAKGPCFISPAGYPSACK